MPCPNCGCTHVRPFRYRYGDQPSREYRCPMCNYQWDTVEVVGSTIRKQAFQATLWQVVNGGDG